MTLRFADVPKMVLAPLDGRPEADWYRAPAGKWTCAQIVEHLAISLEYSAVTFDKRRAHDSMVRRPRRFMERLGSAVILGLGWYPQGFKAPEGTVPAANVTSAAAESKFRAGFTKWQELEHMLLPARRFDLFVKHPRLGDLTLEEWMRFHAVHARHHAKQIKARLAT